MRVIGEKPGQSCNLLILNINFFEYVTFNKSTWGSEANETDIVLPKRNSGSETDSRLPNSNSGLDYNTLFPIYYYVQAAYRFSTPDFR